MLKHAFYWWQFAEAAFGWALVHGLKFEAGFSGFAKGAVTSNDDVLMKYCKLERVRASEILSCFILFAFCIVVFLFLFLFLFLFFFHYVFFSLCFFSIIGGYQVLLLGQQARSSW